MTTLWKIRAVSTQITDKDMILDFMQVLFWQHGSCSQRFCCGHCLLCAKSMERSFGAKNARLAGGIRNRGHKEQNKQLIEQMFDRYNEATTRKK